MTFDNSAALADTPVTLHHDITWRRQRATRSIGQCLRAGMPQFEVKTGGTAQVSVNVHVKMFYQFVTNVQHPAYEQAVTGMTMSPEAVERYRRFVASHAGAGATLEEAITNSKQNQIANTPDHPRNQSILHPDLIDHGKGMLIPRPGLDKPMTHDDKGVMAQATGGLKDKIYAGAGYVARGLGWLWGHRKEVGTGLQMVGQAVGMARPGVGAGMQVVGTALASGNGGQQQTQVRKRTRGGGPRIEEIVEPLQAVPTSAGQLVPYVASNIAAPGAYQAYGAVRQLEGYL
jgi:hypothetical protein